MSQALPFKSFLGGKISNLRILQNFQLEFLSLRSLSYGKSYRGSWQYLKRSCRYSHYWNSVEQGSNRQKWCMYSWTELDRKSLVTVVLILWELLGGKKLKLNVFASNRFPYGKASSCKIHNFLMTCIKNFDWEVCYGYRLWYCTVRLMYSHL